MRTIFFGTPEFAVPTLEALVAAGHELLLVVSQPARPVGRGRRLQDPPVAAWAREHDLPLAQPETVRGATFRRRIEALEPEVAVVVAFGQIFRRRLLGMPVHGCVNLHASLLPRYRGAAPIQWAIAAGERVTGVTTMLMEEGLDTGPILLQEEVAIGADETTPELAERLARRGAALMVRTLEGLATGEVEPHPQRHDDATYAPRIEKRDGRVDWRLPARRIYDRLRAFTPWPGLATDLRGEPLKVLAGRPAASGGGGHEPGELLGLEDGRLTVACGGGTIFGLERVQLPGKRPISAPDLWNGLRIEPGERFGPTG